jgi:hypothetical protein
MHEPRQTDRLTRRHRLQSPFAFGSTPWPIQKLRQFDACFNVDEVGAGSGIAATARFRLKVARVGFKWLMTELKDFDRQFHEGGKLL